MGGVQEIYRGQYCSFRSPKDSCDPPRSLTNALLYTGRVRSDERYPGIFILLFYEGFVILLIYANPISF